MGVATEDSGFSFPKNLSVWWSEETEYVLQRIERWAAYARGYNRLRSVRLSPGRMTMQDEPENRWSISQTTNRLVVESPWAPNFRQQRHKHQPSEQARLRCCALGNLDYKSNGNLDSNCLEAYSLDHSIYFKTIGEIRSELSPESKEKSDNAPRPSIPLDCGDFLSSDFDELDDDDGGDDDEEDLEELDEELEEREEADYESQAGRGGVIQLCRSVINEDAINNNFTMMGFPRKFNAHPTAAAQ